MALNDIYLVQYLFSHPSGDGALIFGMDYRLSMIVTARTEKEQTRDPILILRTFAETNYLPLLSTTYTLDRLECRNRTQPQFAAVASSGEDGTRAANAVPIRSAVVVKKNTDLAGRRRRGRMFLMSAPEDSQIGGVIDSTYQTGIQTFVDGTILVTTAEGNIYNATVFSSIVPVSDELITNFNVRTTMGSIRGRQVVS